MPNWCSNNLTLRHKDTAKLNEAIAAFEDGRFFEHFVPLPDGKWDYGFCCDNWGTKWDTGGENSVVSALGDNTYGFNFDTAWSPPIEVYRVMCAQGFEIEATYHEQYNGETSSTVRDVVGADLDDEYGISEGLESWEEEQENLEIDLDGGLSAINEGHDDDEVIDLDDVKLPPHSD
ncbi:MAG: hypothetical protein EBS73_16835 [Betaproteobacteria bacterium]|nr:hypothetical protein [Betaproteobacteria bacterium]